MGGIDLLNKNIYSLAAERSTRRYWKKIFFNFVDTADLNSFIIHSLHTGKEMDRDRFVMEVLESD